MVLNTKFIFRLFSLAIFALSSAAIANWSVEIATGVPYNLPMPLKITQTGYPDINITAHYKTMPFTSPFYYDLRVGKWGGDNGWEIEGIHHKIYLENTNSQIQSFSISHGYNLFYVNRAWLRHNFIWRLGVGIVIAHPESTVNGQQFDESGGTFNNGGYYLAGPSIQGSIGRRFYLDKHFFGEVEGKITASNAWVKIANGNAVVPNVAFHADFGIGYDFG